MKCKNSYLKSGKLNVCVSCVYGHTYLFSVAIATRN